MSTAPATEEPETQGVEERERDVARADLSGTTRLMSPNMSPIATKKIMMEPCAENICWKWFALKMP